VWLRLGSVDRLSEKRDQLLGFGHEPELGETPGLRLQNRAVVLERQTQGDDLDAMALGDDLDI
jgi:hypothetical protein